MKRKLYGVWKYIGLMLILCGLFMITGCLQNDRLTGEWAVVSDNQDKSSNASIFTFSSESTLTVLENSKGGAVIYRIDSTRNPAWIDWKGTLGIIRFLDNNTLEIGLNMERSVLTNNFGQRIVEPPTRPVNFESSQYHAILRRLAQAKSW